MLAIREAVQGNAQTRDLLAASKRYRVLFSFWGNMNTSTGSSQVAEPGDKEDIEKLVKNEQRRRSLLIVVTALPVGFAILAPFILAITPSQSGLVFGVGVALAMVSYNWVRRSTERLRVLQLTQLRQAALSEIKEADFENVDSIKQLREEKAKADFQRNVTDAFLIDSLELSGVGFFDQCVWRLKPGVNILLGRNGYGKSLLLHSLAALLQRDEDRSKDLFVTSVPEAFAQITVQRNGKPELIRREQLRFTEAAGKIPILAIPDSRFVDRMTTEIDAIKEGAIDLRRDGAKHFLSNLPYGEMIGMLLSELCLDYLDRRSFDQPGFTLIERSIGTLTGDQFKFDSVQRQGRTSFRLFVLTEGNENPLPIQYASQGTLSVLGVVGIIRSYLTDLFPEERDSEDLLNKPAIVFIDELDAHLHPTWQQRLTSILRDNFPNIQFVLSAHSPLVVAGCWSGEVSVLRKGTNGFVLEQLERDFLGTSVAEIYETIFGVEDFDQCYLQSASRATAGFSNQSRIAELENKENATELERRELMRLIREEGMIHRAAEVNTERQDDQERIMELEARIESLENKLTKQGEAQALGNA